MQNRGEGAVFRLIPNKIPRLEDLGLPPVLRALAATLPMTRPMPELVRLPSTSRTWVRLR